MESDKTQEYIFDFGSGVVADAFANSTSPVEPSHVKGFFLEPRGSKRPVVIGVYQNQNYSLVDASKVAGLKAEEEALAGRYDLAIRKYQEGADNAHPNLISIIYDPQTMNKELIGWATNRSSFMGRVKPFSFDSIPNFDVKGKAKTSDLILKVAKAIEFAASEGPLGERLSRISQVSKQYEEWHQTYGLTRDEMATYSLLKKINQLVSESNGEFTLPNEALVAFMEQFAFGIPVKTS